MEIVLILTFIGCAFAGQKIGRGKGYKNMGSRLGLFFGPIGVAIIFYMPDKKTKDADLSPSDW